MNTHVAAQSRGCRHNDDDAVVVRYNLIIFFDTHFFKRTCLDCNEPSIAAFNPEQSLSYTKHFLCLLETMTTLATSVPSRSTAANHTNEPSGIRGARLRAKIYLLALQQVWYWRTPASQWTEARRLAMQLLGTGVCISNRISARSLRARYDSSSSAYQTNL